MGGTEKPEFPDKEVTPEEIIKAETDKTLREVKEVNDKNKSDVKEQEPTEIPSKEQTPGTEADVEKQPEAELEEPTPKGGKKKRLTSEDEKLQETYDNIEKNIVEKVNERNPNLSEKEKKELAAEDALKYLQEDSEWYTQANDREREQAVRDINSRFGVRQARSIKVEDILGRTNGLQKSYAH